MSGAAESVLPSGRTSLAVEVSIVIPCFNSERTLAGCLDALRRQSFTRFEIVIVDSSPGGECEAIVCEHYPEVRYEHSLRRLLPHAARNRGAQAAVGELLVFTDPDVYPDHRWLETLVASHRATGYITVGAIGCHGLRWLDVANHLCKFSTWLPAGQPRPVDMGPTANLLCPRRLFIEMGGFPGERMLGDVSFSWHARRLGHTLWFEPHAVVLHHHTQGLREFVAERYGRGALFGKLRTDWHGNARVVHVAYLLASLLPVRFTRILALTTVRCWRAGLLADLASTLPVVALGHAAWLAGECRSYAGLLAGTATPAED
jgi:GT2 family glycosyltransferase